jgi:hypothetical protein
MQDKKRQAPFLTLPDKGRHLDNFWPRADDNADVHQSKKKSGVFIKFMNIWTRRYRGS